MSILEWRGGFPAVFRGTVTTAGAVTGDDAEAIAAGTPIVMGQTLVKAGTDGRKGLLTSKWLEIRNLDATAGNALQVYFTQKQFTDDVHGLVLPGGASQLSVWQGPGEVSPNGGIWLRAAAGTPEFCITAFSRRG